MLMVRCRCLEDEMSHRLWCTCHPLQSIHPEYRSLLPRWWVPFWWPWIAGDAFNFVHCWSVVINENLGIEMPQDPLNDWMQELTIEICLARPTFACCPADASSCWILKYLYLFLAFLAEVTGFASEILGVRDGRVGFIRQCAFTRHLDVICRSHFPVFFLGTFELCWSVSMWF